ncbi:MAG: TrmH family RNA methyltransferase [Solirubrobacteraceae bacterium]
MTTITSHHNPRLKALRRLQTKRGRASSRMFLAEGEDLLAAATEAGVRPVEGFRLEGTDLGGAGFHDVESSALADVSTLGSGTRVIGVFEQRWSTAATGPLCVYLHGVGDPGNLGTILRSAQAFGASSVALGPKCADPHSPKAVRASMGAIFAVALARVAGVEQLPGRRIALAAEGPDTLAGPQDGRSEPVTLLVGAERAGLPEDVLAACEARARIPIASESLNAAMAATVALYEMTRRGGRDIDTVPAS